MHLTGLRCLLGNHFCSTSSLRSRYLVVTLLMTLVVIAVTLLAHASVERASERHNHAIEQHQEASHHIRLLRSALLDVERSLNAYLWQPDHMARERVRQALNQALSNQQHFDGLEWFKNVPAAEAQGRLGRELKGLSLAIEQLLENRAHLEKHHLNRAKSLFSTLWNEIQLLDQQLEILAHGDLASMNEITNSATHALWLLAVLVLALLGISVVYSEHRILTPLKQAVPALHTEVHRHPPVPMPDANNSESHHLIEAFNEMHQRAEQRQQSLEYLALHDTLTGLANREQLVRAIDKVLTSAVESEREVTLLMIGLNRFREINNSLGHSIGDQLLVAVARRLTANLDNALIARVNGDEFTLLLTGGKSQNADHVARTIIRTLETPFAVESQSLYLSAAIGIAMSPEHGHQPLELLQKAEVAMQVAKQQKIQLTHYSSELDRHARRRLALANTLRKELNGPQDTLSLVYQPQLEMRTGNVCGIEALLRWGPLQEGLVTPDELIPIAEQTGLIYQLTPWVLERAFQEFSSLQHSVPVRPVLAVNLSSLNLHDVDFPHHLQRLMEKWSIDPASLQLEITESAMMADAERAHRTLGQIHSLGVELTIDDFGTGFSSLAYLKHLPVSKLKIDKSFVTSMLQDENDAVIIRSTIDMAHHLGLKVVAEGVETQETYDLLEILDCDIAQGYLISKPLDLATLMQWIPLQQKLAVRHRPLYAGHYPR